MQIRIEVDGERQLQVAIGKISEGIEDLRPYWNEVQNEFYKIEKQLFESEGASGKSGKWKELSSPYKEIKQAQYGDVPILTRTGELYKSLTQVTSDSVVEKERDYLTLGTNLPYPQKKHGRKPIDLTEEDTHEMLRTLTRQLAEMAKKTGLGE